MSAWKASFYLNPFTFVGYRNNFFFSDTNPYNLNITQQCRWSYFEFGPLMILSILERKGILNAVEPPVSDHPKWNI